MATPYAIVALERTSSTQDDARRLLEDRPVLVVAGAQTRGRGRAGSTWETAPRALATSLALRPPWPTDTWPRLSLLAGLAAHRALGPSTRLKWPNDVLIDDAKVAGVLVEASGDVVVLGMGVNLWWPDASPGLAALYADDPGGEEGRRLARRWADAVLLMLEAGPDRWGIDDYRTVCRTIGMDVTWLPAGRGKAIGVDDDGSLLVEGAGRLIRLAAGEVREVRPSDPADPRRGE